jgi:hypothetical protein
MKYGQEKKRSKNGGAVLLIAVLVSSVALAVGLGVYNRTYKELLFASFWKQTQVAFAAADGGLECALYWDLHQAPSPVSCFGNTVLLSDGTSWNPSANVAVLLDITTPICATIEVTKNAIAPNTIIKARGYNSCNNTDPRRVERGLQVDY